METLIFITCYVGIGFIISIISEIAYFLLKIQTISLVKYYLAKKFLLNQDSL